MAKATVDFPKKNRKKGPDARSKPEAWLAKMHRTGQRHLSKENLAQAEKVYRKILVKHPHDAQATYFLGVIAKRRGETDEALGLIERAIALNPNVPAYHFQRALALEDANRRSDAMRAYLKVIELDPNQTAVYSNLGQIHMNSGSHEKAEVLFKKALEIAPDNVTTLLNLAVNHTRKSENDEAAKIYRRILEIRPDHPQARHFLNSLAGREQEGAPRDYVVGLFDNYASRFEQHLVGDLHYRSPVQLRQAVGRIQGIEKGSLNVLDLGCGTGLCGQQFRDLARRMAGVDLSPRMLERAREKGVYDQIEQGDLVEALRKRGGDLDLAVCADVLIYVGDLDETFAACAASLREGGLFAFTTETFAGDGYILRHSGRYAHSAHYVKALAEKYGLSTLLQEEVVIRIEQQKPIAGHLYVLCKGGGDAYEVRPPQTQNTDDLEEAFETARLHHRAHHYEEAETIYRQILEQHPGHHETLHLLGVLMGETGRLESAEEFISEAIRKNPAAPHYHCNLGLLLYKRGEMEKAVASMEKALELKPSSLEALNNLANFMKIQGKLDEAEGYFRKVLELSPAFPQAHNNLAVALAESGKRDEAHRHYKKAVNIDPEYAEAVRNFSRFLLHDKNFAEAGEYCRRLLKLQPGDPEGLEMLAICEREPKTT